MAVIAIARSVAVRSQKRRKRGDRKIPAAGLIENDIRLDFVAGIDCVSAEFAPPTQQKSNATVSAGTAVISTRIVGSIMLAKDVAIARSCVLPVVALIGETQIALSNAAQSEALV
jgi:hypothetical protein